MKKLSLLLAILLTFSAPTQSQISGGGGSVTSVSVTTANGVSGSVATATTTPAISVTLGAITPTTVNGNTVTTGTGTLTLGAGSTLATSATNSITLTSTGATNVTLPTTGTLVAAVTGSWTPTVTASTGTITTVGTVSGTYVKLGNLCHVFFSVVITNNGTGAGSLLIAGMPNNMTDTTAFGSAFEFQVAGVHNLVAYQDATHLRLNTAAGLYPAATGSGHRGGATYQC